MASVQVTRHALDRWRERAATYADAGVADVLVAFREARQVADDEPLPIPRDADKQYRHHKRTGAYFVSKRKDGGGQIVVTVLMPGWQNYLMPKRKRREGR